VKMMNSLTVELNVLRPSMLETALESISYNINRKNANLHFFEFGKTYSTEKTGVYKEEEHFSLYLTGSDHYDEWRKKSQPSDFFVAKGIASSLLKICGLNDIKFEEPIKEESGLDYTIKYNSVAIGKLVEVSPRRLKIFDIKQPVYFIDLNYETVLGLAKKREIILTELGKFQPVFRDLAIIVDKWLPFSGLASTIKKLNLTKLQEIRLFDVFESDKLGANKKSLALNFIFVDENKTLTDKEIDGMMQQIITAIEKQLNGEIRK